MKVDNLFPIAFEVKSEAEDDDDLFSMITPIATNISSFKKLKCAGQIDLHYLENSENCECRMASVTHQRGITAEAYTELVNHHLESFSIIDCHSNIQTG